MAIRHYRGKKATMPQLEEGQIGMTLDSEQVFAGIGEKNVRLLDEKDKTELADQMAEHSLMLTENTRQTMGGAGILTESFSSEDISKFKSLLVDYVVYWYHPNIGITKAKENIQQLSEAGINVVFSLHAIDNDSLKSFVANFTGFSNIIGWVLMDEPDGAGVSIEAQETRINLMRQVTKLPLCVTCYVMNWPIRLISKKFDYYFIDSYMTDCLKRSIDNGTDANFSSYFHFFSIVHFSLGNLVGMDKCIPMLQAFREDATGVLVYGGQEMLKIWNEASSIYNGNACFFLYDAPDTNSYPAGFQENVKHNETLQASIRTFIRNLKSGMNYKNRLLAKTTEFLNNKREAMLTQMLDCYSPLSSKVAVRPHRDPNFGNNSGFDFDIGGVAVIDLGETVKDLYFKAVLQQEADATPTNYKFYRLEGSNGSLGTLLDTVNVVTNKQYTGTFLDFNARYLAVACDYTNAGLSGYVVMRQPSILAKKY